MCPAQQRGIVLIMKNVASSEVDNLVLLSFSVASRMTDDIRRSSEGTGEGKEARTGQGRGEKEGRKRDGMFKREITIMGERRDEGGRGGMEGGGVVRQRRRCTGRNAGGEARRKRIQAK